MPLQSARYSVSSPDDCKQFFPGYNRCYHDLICILGCIVLNKNTPLHVLFRGDILPEHRLAAKSQDLHHDEILHNGPSYSAR